MRILVLGGTADAAALVTALSGHRGLDVTLSLAGRTAAPRPLPVRTRVGGFGGAPGLAAWLRESGTDLLVDATHPFAATMSRNAAEAAQAADVPLLALRRPPWMREPGDRWMEVGSTEEAAHRLHGAPFATPVRVLVTIGRQELAAFLAAAPARHDYLARAIEPISALVPPGREVHPILERGPFTAAAEEALMRREGVGALVTKNAGGASTYGKIAAARVLDLPVAIVRPPVKTPGSANVESAEAALAWILARREWALPAGATTRPPHARPSSTKRGV